MERTASSSPVERIGRTNARFDHLRVQKRTAGPGGLRNSTELKLLALPAADHKQPGGVRPCADAAGRPPCSLRGSRRCDQVCHGFCRGRMSVFGSLSL